MKSISCIFILIVLFTACDRNKSSRLFEKMIDLGLFDHAQSLTTTKDGGFIIAGTTNSVRGTYDAYLAKTDDEASIIWSKTLGGSGDDEAYQIIPTRDGGYAAAGTLTIDSGQKKDIYVIKTDMNGKVVWSNHFSSGIESSFGRQIQELSDGSLIVTGIANPGGGPNQGSMIILHLSSFGTVLYRKNLPSNNDIFRLFAAGTQDGGLITTGYKGTQTNDLWLEKLDKNADVVWTKIFSDSFPINHGFFVRQEADGFIVLGRTGMRESTPGFSQRIYVLKTNLSGDLQWSRDYSFSRDNEAYSVIRTADGNYVLAGRTLDALTSGYFRALLFKFSGSGDAIWAKTFGGPQDSFFYSVQELANGDLVACGFTREHNNIYIVRADPSGNIPY